MHRHTKTAAPASPGAPTPGGDRCNPSLTTVQNGDSIMTQAGDKIVCTPWCLDGDGHTKEVLRADQNCWGAEYPVYIGAEEVAPAVPVDPVRAGQLDATRVAVCAYRSWNALPQVYLHFYRPDDNPHRNLDDSFKLSEAEARQLAAHLVAVADEIGGAR
jgi:hypothetical protein